MFNFDKKIKNILKGNKSKTQSFLTTPVLKGMGGRTTPLHPSRIHSPELIKGGIGDNKPNAMFNKKQLVMGRKVEMEHTINPKIANEIAKDHLTEFPNYYTHLARMEKKLKKTNRKDFHSQTTTPMMDYPADYGVVGKTIKMSPDEFIRRTQSETEQSRNMSQAEYEKSFLGHDKSYMDKLAQAIKSPEPLVDMPYLETKEGIQSEHEGRNRALAARMAGKKTIPVRVVETDRRYIQEKGLRSQYTRDEENKMFRDREEHYSKTGESLMEPVEYGEGKLPRSDVRGKLITKWSNKNNQKNVYGLKNVYTDPTGDVLSTALHPKTFWYDDSEKDLVMSYEQDDENFNKHHYIRDTRFSKSVVYPLIRKKIKDKIKAGEIKNKDDYEIASWYYQDKWHKDFQSNENMSDAEYYNRANNFIENQLFVEDQQDVNAFKETLKGNKTEVYQNLMGDDDDDGVSNSLDCDPNDPNKQGYIHNGQAVLYHGTTRDNAKRIIKSGLKAQENMFGEPAVFLTPSFQHAVYHGTKKKYVNPNVKPAVLEISVPKEETGLTDEQIKDEEHPLREVRIYRNVPAKNIKLSKKRIQTSWGDEDKDGIINVFDKPKMARAEMKKKKKLIGGIGIIREKLDMGGEYGILDTVDEERSITDTAGKHLTGAYWEFEPDTKTTLEKIPKKKRKEFDPYGIEEEEIEHMNQNRRERDSILRDY